MAATRQATRYTLNTLSRVMPVSQVSLKFHPKDAGKAFHEIREASLKWLARRAGRPLPKQAWEGQSFDMLEAGAQPINVLALDKPNYWCFRISDADREVPRRHWVTESGILIHENEVLFGCRLQCVAHGDSPPFEATIPGVVAQVISTHDAWLDGRKISLSAWHLSSEKDVDAFVRLLLNPARSRAIYAISLGDTNGRDKGGAIDADKLAKATAGAAHVVTLTGEASYVLTSRVGKEFSVFHQAVRTYRPGMDIDEDSPMDHPLALPAGIGRWPDGGHSGFYRFLVERALKDTVTRSDIHAELPSYAEMHALSMKQRRDRAGESGASDKELLEMALEENESLRQKLDAQKKENDGLLKAAEGEIDQIRNEYNEARAEGLSLQARIAHLVDALGKSGKTDDVPIPNDFSNLKEWCDTHLSGSVHVLPRAYRIAEKSEFDNPALAYRVLLILRDAFVPMKLEGGLDRKKAYESALSELGLDDAPSISANRVGEQGDEYKVNYDGRPRQLERHIRGSSSRAEKYGFRLYFFWDDETRKVVVGAFPAHLKTRAS